MSSDNLQEKFGNRCFFDPDSNLFLDVSACPVSKVEMENLNRKMEKAFADMEALEGGAVANPDERRMVGHYWLRNPALAPSAEISREIKETLENVKDFTRKVHGGLIAPPSGGCFKHLLVVGIGGSALGPQFVHNALRTPDDPMTIHFFDNTDPDGMDLTLRLIPDLACTLTVVISKSGGTKETRNGQLIVKNAFLGKGLPFNRHFVAVTGAGSDLDRTAVDEGWLVRFPMWDWVGGRTSETSAVGLLPAALHGVDVDMLLQGACHMDEMTRRRDIQCNPAALLALSWYHLCGGAGERTMVVLPYSDRLELFSRYLQQLVMESLGKELDLDGKVVNQGISVFGNKGSTDQHAYVQQLRDGLDNFFVTFLEVLKDGPSSAAGLFVEDGVTAGDYLGAFLQGTRRALADKGRPGLTITIDEVSARTVGMLIALFERAVGFYASMVNINAYHQPGVEAGKKAAQKVLELQSRVLDVLSTDRSSMTVDEIDLKVHAGDPASLFYLLRRLAANGRIIADSEGPVHEWRFRGK